MAGITVKELEQLFKTEPFKFVSLTDAEGNQLVAYNTPKIKLEARQKEIISKLKSSLLPDGNYILLFKDGIANNNVKQYTIQKGKGGLNDAPSVPAKVEVRSKPEVITIKEESVLSYSEALKMQAELAQLRERNIYLEKQNKELLEELDELDDEDGISDDEPEEGGFYERLFEKGVTVIEKYFDKKDEEVKSIQELSRAIQTTPASRPQVAPRPTAPITPTQPTTPAPAAQPTIVYQSPGGGTTPTPPAMPTQEDEQMMNLLGMMTLEDLAEAYEGLKKAGNMSDLKKFVGILKASRPDDLMKIIQKDLQDEE